MKLPAPLRILLTVAVLAAGALLWHSLPVNTEIYAPFDESGRIGQSTKGRALDATVNTVDIGAQAIAQPSGRGWAATGTWVVVHSTVTATDSPVVVNADLLVGPNTYRPSEQFLTGVGYLQPGIAQQRAWAFDVASDVLAEADSVVLRIWGSDPRLDSRLVIDVALSDPGVRRADSVEVPQTVLEAS